MKMVLTPEQKQQLEQMHNTERDRRVCDRIKAVLLASEGWSPTMISQALRIHESTVARHLSDYALSEKLKPENGGSQSLLSDTQTIQLIVRIPLIPDAHSAFNRTPFSPSFSLPLFLLYLSGLCQFSH